MDKLTDLSLRLETEGDRREVEELNREAFWDLYVPGCDEHYLAHCLRGHPDFVPELDYVAVREGRIVGNIMYTRARLEPLPAQAASEGAAPSGATPAGSAATGLPGGAAVPEAAPGLDILTFGPLCVLPAFQRRGVGSRLVELTLDLARSRGCPAVAIYGHPGNYVKFGFRTGKDLRVAAAPGLYPSCLLVLELLPGVLGGRDYLYRDSPAYKIDAAAAAAFDAGFPPRERRVRPSQAEFSILSRSVIA